MTSTNNLSVGSEAEADTDCNDKESYTSLSAEEGSDEEWIAEGIIAEGKIDGETRYLVEWTGFPIKDATWEPRSHVEGVLTKQWEEQKKLQKQGRAEKFDLARWTAGWVQELQAKYERHERRNQARARLGNAPSVWSLTLEENIKQTAEFYPNSESRDDDSSSEEDVPWDKLDRPSGLVPTNRPKSPTSRLQSPETSQSTTTFGIQSQPRGDTGVADSPPSSTEPAKAATGAIIKSTITVLTRPPAHTADSDSKATTAARTQQPRADGVRQLLAGSKPIKAKPTAVKSGSSTKRTGTAAPTQGVSSNIFIQGKKQRSRANLYTASSDLSRKAQLLNHRHRRKLELQRRDRENDAPPRMPKNLISLDPNQRTVENTEGQLIHYTAILWNVDCILTPCH